jgi:guanylate kinase
MTHSEPTQNINVAPTPTTVRGTLFIVAAPSGAGKSSLVNAVLAREPGICLSISFTTRGMRPGERHAQHYHFISRAEFEAMVAAGKDVLLEIDWQGARQVRAQVPDAVSVFILPPSRAALEDRMRKRGQDSEDVIARRLANAREEMSHCGEFDFVIVNEDFDTATAELHSIFTACRLRQAIQARRHAGLLKALLAGE